MTFEESTAAALDQFEHVPDDVLWEVVTRDGACMAVYADGKAPDFTGDVLSDREMAARICAGCPVRDECLELEFRTVGGSSPGVWGALNVEDRQAVYAAWLARRVGGWQ
ncbi:WhiB family transcriptional regulator [Actinokineospora terrae]|uniref:WhiB family transcriptional regulator, redox-sensing transcriptional regulator n=1 Tax=Actinokineospora terrae TaxID=155974 RepID=A0A1H9RTV7_9PSEU|nr:WhiB family transcriptional regulator, redox-sensing transcriptional regulator [Actinokineospora terrae]